MRGDNPLCVERGVVGMPQRFPPVRPRFENGDFLRRPRQRPRGRRGQYPHAVEVEDAPPSELTDRRILLPDVQCLVAGPAKTAWSGRLFAAAVPTDHRTNPPKRTPKQK